jgi:hypothetical protein
MEQKESELEVRQAHELQSVRMRLKGKLKKAQEDLSLHIQRAENAVEHYESIIDDLHGKQRNYRETERKSQEQLKQIRAELNALQTKASEAAVEGKLKDLKIATLEERLKREELIRENQKKAQLLQCCSEVDSQVRAAKNEWELKLQSFLIEIGREFRSIVNDTRPITIESTKMLIGEVAAQLEYLTKVRREFIQVKEEISQIEQILGTNAIVPALSELVRKAQAREFRFRRDETQSGEPWDQWARRILTSATGRLSVGKCDEEIQSQLETIVLARVR